MTSLSLMPKPFDWITIPTGKVLLENYSSDRTYLQKNTPTVFDVAEFQIAKYPVTNAQFAKFIEADGYNTQKWWTEAGWQNRTEGWHYNGGRKASGTPWTEPRYWLDERFIGDDKPVVGVSWYETIAFCLWLSDITGEKIMLPTEQEWQRAAQGDDGRAYPWGNNWDSDLCNNDVDDKDIGKTTPVTQYEGKAKGDSPFCVVDMAGNVWEWCRTNFKDGKQNVNGTYVRVLRGGSWSNDESNYFRCVVRLSGIPDNWYLNMGFRLARS